MASPDVLLQKDHLVEDGLVTGEVGRLKVKESGDCGNLGPERRDIVDLNRLWEGRRAWK